jgi:hypothetical protein
MLAVSSVLGAGCTTAVDGRPVAAFMRIADDSQCTKVDAPLTTVPPAAGASDGSEPTLRIPQPEGWERFTELDSPMIRFAMRNPRLGVNNVAASVAVTIESHPREIDAATFFDESRRQLAASSWLGATDIDFSDGTLCGLPAQTVHYTIPERGAVPPLPVTAVIAVVFSGGNTHGAVLSIQSPVPDNADYKRDADTITSGFQVLAPDPGSR